MNHPKNLVGRVFGRLTVLEFAGYRHGKYTTWRCRCECGSELVVAAKHLHKRRSCGCAVIPSSLTHGASKTPEFRAWIAMRHRCTNPKAKCFKDYGGRGIRVCQRWINSFENFLADMGPRPSPLHSLDRYPDNNGHYEPGNCRWATTLEQGANKRNSGSITWNGETRTIRQWTAATGLAPSTLKNRLKAGWPISEALTRGFSQGNRNDLRRLKEIGA